MAHTHSLLMRAKVSSRPTDDLIVLDPADHQLHILTTGDGPRTTDIDQSAIQFDALRRPPSAILSADGAPVAVLLMRLNSDALSDLVVLQSAQVFAIADSNIDNNGPCP
jgi:hypothetical protein